MLPKPLRVKHCPVLPPVPSAISLSPEESLLLAVSKQHLGICQLGQDWVKEGALPKACVSLGPCCLPTLRERAAWDPGQNQLNSAELVLSSVFPPCPQLSPLSHLHVCPQLGLDLQRPPIPGWAVGEEAEGD